MTRHDGIEFVLPRSSVLKLHRGETVVLDFGGLLLTDGRHAPRITIIPEGGFIPPRQFVPCSDCDRPDLCAEIKAGSQPCLFLP